MFTILIVFLFMGCASAKSGKMHPLLDHRIVGGEDADIEDFPWQVSLQLGGWHFCGGSIISQDWVLTAAHCVIRRDKIRIRSGSKYWSSGGTIQDSKKIIVHPNYDDYFIDNDVALVKASQPFPKRYIIDLFHENEHLPSGSPVTVTGWGVLEPGDNDIPCVLQKVDVVVVCSKICNEIYEGITPNMICAGTDEGGKDACFGDSGGALIHNNRQLGIVSFGYGCGIPKLPAVYAKVSSPSIRTFIHKHTNI